MPAAQYTTREQVKSALDVKESARNNAQIDRAILSGARAIEGQLRRKFYPWTGTRYFDWPNRQRAQTGRLWLDGHELISVTLLSSGGVTISATDYFLEPVNAGPPYTYIEIDRASNAAWASNTDTAQRSIAVTGVFGFNADEESLGTLAGSLNDSATTTTVTWSTANYGVGDILRIDSERLIITERSLVDSTQNLGGSGLTASAASMTVPVTTGSAFFVGETILIESERMLIVDIAGNNLVVKRATDGTALAAHTAGVDVYALTGLTLARGQLGTTATSHLSAAVVYRHVVPPLINDLNIAEAMVQLQQEGSAYGRVVGSGESQREASGKGLAALRCQARETYGRQARQRAI